MDNQLSLSDFLLAVDAAGYDWDLQADQLMWYGNTNKIFGIGVVPPINSREFYEIVYIDDRPTVFGTEKTDINRKYRIQTPSGAKIWVLERGSTILENGNVRRQCCALTLTEKPQDKISQAMAYGRDPLTGCFDQNYMRTQIVKTMDAAKAARRIAGYLVVGIDKMSFVNEAIGMEAGDALLRGVATRIAEAIPTRSILGRVGGDMFGIILPEPLGNELSNIADLILQNFRDHPVKTSFAPIHVTVSIGGVKLPTIAKNGTEGMIFAEQAFHDAHQRGRNLFVEYMDSPERAEENRHFLKLGERINHAFKNNGFRLAYQPIVDAGTNETVFYEALVRMFDEEGKLVPASEFVPAIEHLGLAYDLDQLVLDLAIKELEMASNLRVAINVSGLTAVHANWPQHMMQRLSSRPHVASRLIVEITETAAIVDVSETRRFVDCVRELGAIVSLDDFGAGFTAIRHLRALGLSIMKIDKDLLKNILTNHEQQHMVRVLVDLAHGLSLKVVAEGVETAESAEWLRLAKVDYLQGYYFGKPALGKPWQ